jgi:hypothetical protein
MSGALRKRARDSAQGFVAPPTWGEQIQLEVDEFFDGRHREWTDEGGRSGAWLLWNEVGEPCFIFGCYRLRQAFEREKPNLGDRVSIYRDENYHSSYDEPGEATGLGYGAACEPCNDPPPESDAPEDDDGIPFLCRAGSVTRSVSPAAAATR